MSFLGNLFSRRNAVPEYPPVDKVSTVGRRLEEVEPELQELMSKVSQPLEVVPAEHAAYVFIGKPPSSFGLAWIHDGTVSGLNTLIQEHGVAPAQVEKVVDELRSAYSRHQDAQHFSATVGKRQVVVTASEGLENEVHEIIENILH